MLSIFLHQIHDHLKSLRFQVSFLAMCLFFIANGTIYSWKIVQLQEEVARVEANYEGRYEGIETVSQAVGAAYRVLSRPLGTEFICEGGRDWLDDSSVIRPASGRIPSGANRNLTLNNWLERFRILDWTLIGSLVLSFLCVVMAYDTVSGEAENGVLRLVLANPLSRGRYLAAKFLAHLGTVMVAVLLGTVISLLVLSLTGAVEVGGPVLRAYIVFLLATGVYATLFLFLALGVSSLTRSSASSLIFLMLAWAVLTVIVPQASYLVATYAVDMPSDPWDGSWEYMEEVEANLEREGLALRGPEVGRADGFAVERRYAQRIRAAEREVDQMMERADRQMLRQFEVAKTVNLLSPGFAFQYAVEAGLGTGMIRRESFFQQTREYREVLREFLRAKDEADASSPGICFFPGYVSQLSLDHREIPRLREQPLSLADGLAAGVVPIVLLLLETAAAFFFALWAMNRRDLGAGP